MIKVLREATHIGTLSLLLASRERMAMASCKPIVNGSKGCRIGSQEGSTEPFAVVSDVVSGTAACILRMLESLGQAQQGGDPRLGGTETA